MRLFSRPVVLLFFLSSVSVAVLAQQAEDAGGFRFAQSYDPGTSVNPVVTMAIASVAASAPKTAAASKPLAVSAAMVAPVRKAVAPWVHLNARTNFDGSVRLLWQTNPDQANKAFLIERSPDGLLWDQLGQVNGTDTVSQRDTYQFLDKKALPAGNYRLFCLIGDTHRMYTGTVSVLESNKANKGLRYYAVQQQSIAVGLDVSRVRFPVTVAVYCEDGGIICYDTLDKPASEFLVELPDRKDKEQAVRLQVVDGLNQVLTTRLIVLPQEGPVVLQK